MNKRTLLVGVIAFVTGGVIFSVLSIFLVNSFAEDEAEQQRLALEERRQAKEAARVARRNEKIGYGAILFDGWDCAETRASESCDFQILDAEPSSILKEINLKSGIFRTLHIREFGDSLEPHMVARFGWETECDTTIDYEMRLDYNMMWGGKNNFGSERRELRCLLINEKSFLVGNLTFPVINELRLPEDMRVIGINWGGFQQTVPFHVWPHHLLFQSYSRFKNSRSASKNSSDTPSPAACRRMHEEAQIAWKCIE